MKAPEIVHLSRFDTALGPMSLASTERGIVACSLPGERGNLRGDDAKRRAPAKRSAPDDRRAPDKRRAPEKRAAQDRAGAGTSPADHVRAWLDRRMPRAEIREGTGRNGAAITAVRDFLAGRRRELDLPLDLRGTDFQKKVWAALRRVPYGGTISYGELAARAGHPRASRACGSANGSNPVPLFVPCHRTIASGGKLGGFGGGLELKARLLELERAHAG